MDESILIRLDKLIGVLENLTDQLEELNTNVSFLHDQQLKEKE